MDTTNTVADLKRLALLKNDGATDAIRQQAAREYAVLKDALRAEMAKPKNWRAA